VVVTGKIRVVADLEYGDEDSHLALVGLQKVEVEGADYVDAFLFSNGLTEVVRGSCPGSTVYVTGGLAGRNVEYTAPLELVFDEGFSDAPPPGVPSGGVEVLDWREGP